MSSVFAGRVAVGLALGTILVAGCARFDESASSPFTDEPSIGGANAEPKPPQDSPSQAPRPTGPCIDPDPNVIATCLDSAAGLVAIGDGALVAERRTGRVLSVTAVDASTPQPPPEEVAVLPVDGSSDGGISDITLSPTFAEDGLMYAYITTGSDNRVVRLSRNGAPKEILTGIPKGATGNRGALEWVTPNQLLVLTGDAGNPAAAADPGSLGGKLLRLDSPSSGANTPQVVASGVGTAGDLCRDGKDGMWVTDRTAAEDRLQHLGPDGTLTVAWTWPDRPGVGGCVATGDGVAVALTEGKALAAVTADPATFAVTTAPTLIAQDKYGKLLGATAGSDGSVWVSTANKTDGAPGEFDDRVVRIPPPQGGAGGPD
ncbi:PQQ-dependent sugar dehydrogenase [Nocardia caishijiensis]|uniref:Glucose/arabinose dehydrogenase n=1 Tax=Nocardia caishijiensis TaxID=184756 RepID=A0ABQ6YF88_9NOCA|nr:PQQ-dependent sugar dehydrogenase [Nocardia caishijiensis]KAF0836656.1 glucose/arabinose dehydrogenase [Nocardia caishijiensis]